MNPDDVEADKPAEDTSSAEKAADLASLEARAVSTDQAAPGAPGAAAAADQVQPPSEQSMMFAGILLRAVRPLAGYAVPALKEAPDELWGPAVEGTAALLDHYGVGGSAFASTPWGRFAFGVVPLVGFVAVHQLTAPKEDKPAGPDGPARNGAPMLAAPAPAPAAPGQNRVIIGAPQPL